MRSSTALGTTAAGETWIDSLSTVFVEEHNPNSSNGVEQNRFGDASRTHSGWLASSVAAKPFVEPCSHGLYRIIDVRGSGILVFQQHLMSVQ